MEIDYSWNGQYYSSTAQSASALVVQSHAKSCGDTTQSSTDTNSSLLHYILIIVYLYFYQTSNIDGSSTKVHSILNDLSKIDSQVVEIEEAILRIETSLNDMVYGHNDSDDGKSDQHSTLFSNHYSSNFNKYFDSTDYCTQTTINTHNSLKPKQQMQSKIDIYGFHFHNDNSIESETLSSHNVLHFDAFHVQDSFYKMSYTTDFNHDLVYYLNLSEQDSDVDDKYQYWQKDIDMKQFSILKQDYVLKIHKVK